MTQNVGSAAASPADQIASEDFADDTRRGRILVVDDLEIVRDLLGHYLALAGYEVDVVAGGAEAVEAARTRRYDLVLMDIQMPGVDGLAATRLIRGLGAGYSETPIIAVTPEAPPEQTRRYLDAGMSDYVGKPINRDAILLKVAQWLSRVGQESAVPNVGSDRSDVVFDETTFQEFSQLVGSESAHKWLRRLLQSLRSVFPEEGGCPLPSSQLAQQLQLLISQAGTLGLSELSRRLGELEEACLKGTDMELPRARAAKAASVARELITKIATEGADSKL